MTVDLDILDTNIWYYAVNGQYPWAVRYYDEVIAGDRVVYVSRYIAAEFYRKMAQTRGTEGKDLAYDHLKTLWEADAAFAVHPYVLSGYELREIRYNPRNLLLSNVLGVITVMHRLSQTPTLSRIWFRRSIQPRTRRTTPRTILRSIAS